MKKQVSRNILKRVAGAVAIAFAGGGLFTLDASASILNTKHNLSGASTPVGITRINSFTASDANNKGEICVFCHTPHGADTSAAVPLWNRKLGAQGGQTYTTYNSLGTSSLDGATAPVGSVSLACLSCHDGTQAMNTMINQPGSGGYNANGGDWAGTWSGADQTSGKMSGATNIALLGVDLRNDHPIGIQYGGGPKSGSVPQPNATTTTYDRTLFRDSDFHTANSAVLNGNPVWWVDTDTNGTREKTDIQLYTRSNQNYLDTTGGTMKDTSGNLLTLSGAQPFVECASCHDPHTENVTFLRVKNENSKVCLTCHDK